MINPFEVIDRKLSAIEQVLHDLRLQDKRPATSTVTIEPDELLTPEETAKLLKVTKVTVWDWEKRGILNARRIGNQVRYLRSEVIAATKPKRGGANHE